MAFLKLLNYRKVTNIVNLRKHLLYCLVYLQQKTGAFYTFIVVKYVNNSSTALLEKYFRHKPPISFLRKIDIFLFTNVGSGRNITMICDLRNKASMFTTR